MGLRKQSRGPPVTRPCSTNVKNSPYTTTRWLTTPRYRESFRESTSVLNEKEVAETVYPVPTVAENAFSVPNTSEEIMLSGENT